MGHCEKKDPTEAEPFYEKYKNETQSANPFLDWRIKPVFKNLSEFIIILLKVN